MQPSWLKIGGFTQHPKVATACGNTGNNLSHRIVREFFPLQLAAMTNAADTGGCRLKDLQNIPK
jgi:hypothetical protein